VITSRQGVALVAVLALVGAAFASIQRRNARAVAESKLTILAQLDSLAEAAQASADDIDARIAADPNAQLEHSTLPAPEIDTLRILATLNARGASTYLDEILAGREGKNVRWPDRLGLPMRVWVQRAEAPNFDERFVQVVRDGFSAWGELGLPLQFTFVLDSSRAEIVVTWVDRFEGLMTGRTVWRHDQHGWIVGGTIQLALHQPDGRPLREESVAAITRHEVGHLIGLDHTADLTSIMSAQVHVTELSEADRRTARLVYDLPPGRLPR